jgi:DNA-directed RNA polymerase specialized sigma24 family protein
VTPRANEESIDVLLRSNEAADRQRGLAAFFERHRPEAVRLMRRGFPWVSHDLLEDAVSEGSLYLLRCVRNLARSINESQAAWLLFRASRCRVIDYLRQQTRHRSQADQLLDQVAERLSDAEGVGGCWKRLSPAERAEVRCLLPCFIERLPPRQRSVLLVWLSHFPASEHGPALRDLVAAETGAELSLDTINAALRHGRTQLRKDFTRAGYAFDQGGDV